MRSTACVSLGGQLLADEGIRRRCLGILRRFRPYTVLVCIINDDFIAVLVEIDLVEFAFRRLAWLLKVHCRFQEVNVV